MITIITLTYNNYQDLINTLNTLRELKREEVELIVVDGGNCEHSKKFVTKYESEVDFEVKYLLGPDEGISDGFNKGIKAASGDAIIFLNSGDKLISGNYLAWANSLLRERPEVAMINADIVFEDQFAGKLLMRPLAGRYYHRNNNENNNRKEIKKYIGRGMLFWHQTMIVRREVFSGKGENGSCGFKINYRFAMDYEWLCRFLNNENYNHYFYYHQGPVVSMDGGGVSVKKEFNSIKECFRALNENQLLNARSLFYFSQRVILFLVRRLLLLVGGNEWMKKIKYCRYKQG